MASTTISEKIRKQLAALPARPGVYIMRNARGEVIYVGKAARLKDRVRSYFGSAHGMEPKTFALRQQIDDFEFIVVNSPGEALLLEATLIKRHQPFFNIRLKDDKRYPYLKIDIQNPWPRVFITRRIEKDGARYFGPYASAGSVRATLDLTKKLFPWRSCTKEITGRDPRPCLDYYIKRCIAPCTGYCTKEEYDEVIEQVILFLEGKSDDVIRRLTRQMEDAAERMEFERAAMIRDQVRAIERTIEKQMVHTTKKEDLDAFGIARNGDQACVQVFFVRGTQMIGRDTFVLEGTSGEPDILSSGLPPAVPRRGIRLVVVPVEPAEREELEAMLSERRSARVEIRQPERGEKRRLVQMAGENAREALDMMRVKWLADSSKTEQALEQLREELSLPAIPRRIECYDNSNIQGTNPVSSMVVFIDGKPANNQYRRFKVKTVVGADDFATMAEIMRRRFRHAAPATPAEPAIAPHEDESPDTGGHSPADDQESDRWDLPDLVIIDGGKGQLGAAASAMREMGVHHIPVVGLAKRFEELFVPDEDEPIVLPRGSEALYLVQRIRDEAHRFAITFHRQVRGKTAIASALDSIQGVGPKRKKALLKKFGSVKAIREANVEEIASTLGFTRALADRVKAEL
ncbi:MAG: excinuclease ABC subunit UvrC [Dehalococcoidia bacterium]|nr:excinuclease ABC subunit UvrC [Dehalococcoidia bacterium]